ncbi:MAG: hypothetical protein JNL44_11640 [Gemmatimonadetes bacterium]|nr:hypothetical protein [Gemmatimonadota bacterium]
MTNPGAGRREWVFRALLVAIPVLVLSALEVAARIGWRDGALPAFTEVPGQGGRWLVANPVLAARWFPAERNPPSTSPEFFAARKPENGFRVIVLGESAAQGFPYPRTGAFSRVVAEVLRDALPGDSVEVVNLAIAATNSYAMLDVVDEVIAQRPDAVLYYGGHNEYYGALGVGSTVRLAAAPALTRAFLLMQRSRALRLANRWIARWRAGGPVEGDAGAAASFMEAVAADRDLVLDGDRYRAGVAQYEGNLRRIVRRLRAAGVAVYVGSVVSNLRDQPPFVTDENAPAREAFAAARAAADAGDSAVARAGFARARDLDVIRFRAPAAFTEVARRVAEEEGATYVPVAERFAEASPGGVPGAELLLEHVHPNRDGQLLLARAFWESMRNFPPAGVTFDTSRLASWQEYDVRRALTSVDERIAAHRVAALTARWPFRAVDAQLDYRVSYRPTDPVDSIAFMASAGAMPWEIAKISAARWHEAAGAIPAAVAEYRGLGIDQPALEAPWRLAGTLLARAGRLADADSLLATAMARQPTVAAGLLRARIAAQERDWPRAILRLREVLVLEPSHVEALYQLSLAQALAGDAEGARATAARLARIAPNYPPLAEWMRTLAGATPP